MRIQADRVSVDGPHGRLLPPTSLTVAGGELALLHGDPGTGLTAFGLALAGRLRPGTGAVTLDGDDDRAGLRRAVGLVDVPGVSEPDDALPLRVVVGEELALARRGAGRAEVAAWLAAHDLAPYAGTRFENLEPAVRTRLLADLAAARPGVVALVLDTPDRHTSDTGGWWTLATEHAARGLAVVVLTATVPSAALPAEAARAGSDEQPAPTRCAPEPVPAGEAEGAGE
ncbi:ABC transporter ATP-binding protein [Amycolatopsis antarctica]|uniref:ABC transporter ATP-binding protein n=1 Tax=Amycolatopsis antarctica TaxID=1854586 RepID=A0A263D113_9PSEU|nr:ABC transporter ATP-binding protein [Amycolatopsis antarctica]OZM72164.1 ABC transporter ATP-binding protein [Amycolatopsis antarctica]